MKFMIFGPGNAREYATFRRLRAEAAGARPLLATTSSPALLEGETGVFQVRDVDQAIELCELHEVDQVVVMSPNPVFDGAVALELCCGATSFSPTSIPWLATVCLTRGFCLPGRVISMHSIRSKQFRCDVGIRGPLDTEAKNLSFGEEEARLAS